MMQIGEGKTAYEERRKVSDPTFCGDDKVMLGNIDRGDRATIAITCYTVCHKRTPHFVVIRDRHCQELQCFKTQIDL